MQHLFRLKPIIICIFLFCFLNHISAQKSGLEVTRSSAIERDAAVLNIAVDAAGTRWASNAKGVFQVKGPDIATKRILPEGELSVLKYPGGNADITWSEAAFRKLAKTESAITAAWYDEKNKQLWIGTEDAGVFQCKTEPQLDLIDKFTSGNSKMKSNAVTIIFQDKSGRFWIGTQGGLMLGLPGKWKSNLDNYEVRRVREYGSEIYVLGDGELMKTLGGEKWTTITLEESKIENEIMDFDIDKKGKLWAVSGVVTSYDLLGDQYHVFDGAENYASYYGNRIVADPDGNVWVGTTDKGLYLIAKGESLEIDVVVEHGIECNGNGKDAELRVRLVGGIAPFKYVWSGGLTGDNPKNIAPGNYDLTISDAKGRSRSIQIPVPDTRMKVTVRQKKPASAPDKADGAAELDIAGNASGIKVLWDNGETLVTALKLTSGKHTATVTNQKGCSSTVSIDITGKDLPLAVSIAEKAAIKCTGDKTAALSATVSGGKAPFQYAWSASGLTGEQPANVASGEYVVTVTDAAGNKTTATISVKQPETLILTAIVQSPASTGNSNGKAMAQPKGGSGTFSYKWDNGETTATATKLAPGKRTAIATDANGCTATASVEISENILPLAVSIAEKAAIKCAGDKTAALSATVSGGKAPFQYAWSASGLTGEQPANVASGEYVVTVTDAAGNKTTATISIKQPEALTLTAIVQSPASTGNSDGKAMAQPKGGSGTFSYKWDNGETTATATKLAPGKRTVIATDANGCTATASVEISENILPLAVNIAEKAAIKCAGDKTAALSATVSGGKAPFQYAWSASGLTGEQPANVASGEYVVTVTDAAGNKTTATISIKQPEALTLTAIVQSPASTGNSDGKAVAQPKGGSGTFSYKWDNGETTATATKLAPGKRTVAATDANGCAATASVEISENILPLAVNIAEKAAIKCTGDKTAALSATVSGGKAPFQYAWSASGLTGEQPANVASGDYVVTVTDAAGNKTTATISIKQPEALTLTVIVQSPASTGNSDGKAVAQPKGGSGTFSYKWDNGETTATATKLAPGKRTVAATDANGCAATASVEISENILPLAVNITEKTAIKCTGDKTAALSATVSGGKAPFQYAWSASGLTGEQPANVASGEYVVTVTDAAGNKTTATISIKQPEALTLTAIVQSPASTGNSDGKATAQPKGGSGTFSYKWDNGETTATATKLAPGKRTVAATDANGCAATASVEISENILPLAVNITEKTAIKCAGDKGALAVTVSGGKPPYQFNWNNPAAQGDNPTNLEGGNYTLTVTDSKGTTFVGSASFSALTPLTMELTRNLGATKDGINDGKAAVGVKGGTTPYNIVWDTKQTGQNVSKLALGAHSVTATDAKGCVQTIEFNTEKRILPELTGAVENGQTIRMRLLNFPTDSANVQEDAFPVLDELYDFLVLNSGVIIEIGGHTNNQPSDDFADKLSTARAKSVTNYLTTKGIAPQRVQYKGYGKRYPIASNLNPEGRKVNQRVEIKILKVSR